jgi:hypothetical protein
MGTSRTIYLQLCMFVLFGSSRGFDNTWTTGRFKRRIDLSSSPSDLIVCETEISCFRRTGIKRELEWGSVSNPVSLKKEISLLESGVLARRGEYCSLYGDRLDEVEAECKLLGMTLVQGLLIRKQLMVSKVVASSWKLKDERKLNYIIRTFERQQSPLLEIARDMDLPPVSVFRAIVASRVFDAYPDLLDRDKKRIVKSIISERNPENIKEFLSESELKELQKAKECDMVGYSEQTETPVLWEKALYAFLDDQDVNYVTEDALREAEMKITPDCLILDDCYINDQLVRWVDVKSFYGSGLRENRHFSNSLKKQVEKYETEFGESGAVVFKHGFSSKLRNKNPSTLFLDAGPLSEDSDFNIEKF